MPNFWAKRRSSPTAAARSFRSTKWTLMRRSAKKRSAARVSELFFTPKICTSMAGNIFHATMSPRSKIILAAVLFSSGGAAIKWCSFGAWQLAACRAALAMLTILILLPEARRGWSWRTIVVGFAYAATTLLYVQANKHTTAASAIFLQSTSPLFILLLAPLLLGEHATRRDIMQMAIMGAGLGLFFLGMCQLGIPYLFLARAVPQVRALEVGLFLLIEPVLNPIWAWLVHGETPGPATLVGGAVILGATAGRMILDVRGARRESVAA